MRLDAAARQSCIYRHHKFHTNFINLLYVPTKVHEHPIEKGLYISNILNSQASGDGSVFTVCSRRRWRYEEPWCFYQFFFEYLLPRLRRCLRVTSICHVNLNAIWILSNWNNGLYSNSMKNFNPILHVIHLKKISWRNERLIGVRLSLWAVCVPSTSTLVLKRDIAEGGMCSPAPSWRDHTPNKCRWEQSSPNRCRCCWEPCRREIGVCIDGISGVLCI